MVDGILGRAVNDSVDSLVLLSFQPGQSSLSSSRTLAVQSPGRARAFILPGYLQDVMLELDILNSHGMEEGCLCAPEGIKPGMEPLWIPPLWSSERGRGETQNTTRRERFHPLSVSVLQTVLPCWGSRTFQHPALEGLKSIKSANDQF